MGALRNLVASAEKLPLFALVAASASSHSSRNLMEALCAHSPMLLLRSDCRTRLCRMRNTYCCTFWPNDLAVYYPFAPSGIPAWQIIGAAFLLIGITAFCVFQRKIRPYLIVGWLWFLGNTGSRYRTRSGWRANHGGSLLLYSVNRFVHCARVRISRHRQELACCASGSAQE